LNRRPRLRLRALERALAQPVVFNEPNKEGGRAKRTLAHLTARAGRPCVGRVAPLISLSMAISSSMRRTASNRDRHLGEFLIGFEKIV